MQQAKLHQQMHRAMDILINFREEIATLERKGIFEKSQGASRNFATAITFAMSMTSLMETLFPRQKLSSSML